MADLTLIFMFTLFFCILVAPIYYIATRTM